MELQRVWQDWATEHTNVRNKTCYFMHFLYRLAKQLLWWEREKLHDKVKHFIVKAEKSCLHYSKYSTAHKSVTKSKNNWYLAWEYIIDLFAVDTNRESTLSELIKIVSLLILPLDISTISWIPMSLLVLILLF